MNITAQHRYRYTILIELLSYRTRQTWTQIARLAEIDIANGLPQSKLNMGKSACRNLRSKLLVWQASE
ncbi:hypothetical protein D3C80_2206960 [compost metagenome]